MKNNRTYGPSLVLVVCTIGLLLGGPSVMRRLAYADQAARVEGSRERVRTSALVSINEAQRELAKMVKPSVVHLQVMKKPQPMSEGMQRRIQDYLREQYNLPDDYDFENDERFGGRGGRRGGGRGEDNERYREYDAEQPFGSGSGWVYRHTNGETYIVTNHHVVEDADTIEVKFSDKSTRKATLVGEPDPKTDIAVLKVKNGELHPAVLSDGVVEQGELVFAFGSPFQFDFSMSQGIVSGQGRELGILRDVGGYENFIQTDAAINPGNSGGPLMNIYGEVIGMNTAIATQTGSYSGLGFAIPADMIRHIVRQIIDNGSVRRGFLGIQIGELDPDMARSFGYDGQGVLVSDLVGSDSPAGKAGIRTGDIIVEIEGRPVRSGAELRRSVAAIAPDETIKVKVYRDGKYKDFRVTLAEYPKDPVAMGGGGRFRPEPQEEKDEEREDLEPLRRLGLEGVETLNDDVAEQFSVDLDEVSEGVVVTEVRRGSVAESKRLFPGMVITQVMGRDVSSVRELAREIGKHELAEGVRLRVVTAAGGQFVFLQLKD